MAIDPDVQDALNELEEKLREEMAYDERREISDIATYATRPGSLYLTSTPAYPDEPINLPEPEPPEPEPEPPEPTPEPPPPPDPGNREIINASGDEYTGTVVLPRSNVIYDFGDRSAGRDITITGDNTEARNIKGSGARRVNANDSGFYDFEFSYAQVITNGVDRTRPYFMSGLDVGPDLGDSTPIHCYAYRANIYDPHFESLTITGAQLPPGSLGHNDAIHISNAGGGPYHVYRPTLINCSIKSGAAHGLLTRYVKEQITVIGCDFERIGTAHWAAFINNGDVAEDLTLLWQNNEQIGYAPNHGVCSARSGVTMHPDSDTTIDYAAGGVILP